MEELLERSCTCHSEWSLMNIGIKQMDGEWQLHCDMWNSNLSGRLCKAGFGLDRERGETAVNY